MSVQRPSTAARVAAPVAFLVAVTIAVLLVRAGLSNDESPAPGGAVVTAVEPKFHVIAQGDTLARIAARYGTDVDEIEDLNPGVDPVSLEVGSRLRIR